MYYDILMGYFATQYEGNDLLHLLKLITMENQTPESTNESDLAPAAQPNPRTKSMLPLLIGIIVLLLAVILYLLSQLNQTKSELSGLSSMQALTAQPTRPVAVEPSATASTTTENTKLLDMLKFSEYVPVEDSLLTSVQGGAYHYSFTDGQDSEADIHNNYRIKFPTTWEAFTYTNDRNRDDHGTNLLLKKGNDVILIKQQLFESGTCYFDPNDESFGMSYLCTLEQALTVPEYDWKVFTVPSSASPADNASSWKRYGVCDQDAYAEGISSYTTPDDHDKALCSPWTAVGEIEFYSTSGDKTTYQEFVNIVESIRVQE